MPDLPALLAALLAEPAGVNELPPEIIPALLAQASAELARFAALEGALAARLAGTTVPSNGRPPGRRLTIDEAATRTGMSKDWLYRHAPSLPFTRRLGRTVRFDEAELERWMANRRPG